MSRRRALDIIQDETVPIEKRLATMRRVLNRNNVAKTQIDKAGTGPALREAISHIVRSVLARRDAAHAEEPMGS